MIFEQLRFRMIVSTVMRVIGLRYFMATALSPELRTTPDQFPVRDCTIESRGRFLEARLVSPGLMPSCSVLILHGIGERLGYWHDVQQMLGSHDIASLVFHYSGYGLSSGAITPANLREDTIAAYAGLRDLVSTPDPPFVLGLSLGTGVAVDAARHLQPTPSGIILCEPFSSLRGASVAVCKSLGSLGALLRPLTRLVPDIYRTAATIKSVRSPVLIVHSDADELFPVAMAREIHAAAGSRGTAGLVIVRGFAHNDAYLRPSLPYWGPILGFLGRTASGTAYGTASATAGGTAGGTDRRRAS